MTTLWPNDLLSTPIDTTWVAYARTMRVEYLIFRVRGRLELLVLGRTNLLVATLLPVLLCARVAAVPFCK